ncbi:hypothetical protein BDR07DRAFT_1382473 [Suillus spraguei]|nr:hypothetical protein BDR07DRAFT_1382473 [Suillus spraguei]
MVLTGGTFNDRNVRKMQKKFNVTWDHFAQHVEVTDVMKFNGKVKEYHKLICYKDENMCGLDDYPGVDHGTGSLDMIERFIKAKETSWAAKKEAATSAKPEAPVEKGNGKQGIHDAHEEPAESVNGEERPDENAMTSQSHNIVKASAMGAIGREHALSKEEKQDKLTMSSSHKRLSDGPKVSDGVRVKQWDPRNLSRKDRQKWMVQIAAEMHPNTGDRCVEQWVISELHIPTSKDHRCNLMTQGCIEGNGVTVTTSLLAWMIERYWILVGLPLDEHLNGQIILQSPDQYENMQEHDYYEVYGIERLYATLVNAEESPGHLINLAHALGRAAKETNMLSKSKPDTLALDPLPPQCFLALRLHTDREYADEHDQSVSGHASMENEQACSNSKNYKTLQSRIIQWNHLTNGDEEDIIHMGELMGKGPLNKQSLKRGETAVHGDQWQYFCMLGFKHVFTSPSSVNKEPKAMCSGNAYLYGMKSVTKDAQGHIDEVCNHCRGGAVYPGIARMNGGGSQQALQRKQGNCMGTGNPRGSWVWVPLGYRPREVHSKCRDSSKTSWECKTPLMIKTLKGE